MIADGAGESDILLHGLMIQGWNKLPKLTTAQCTWTGMALRRNEGLDICHKQFKPCELTHRDQLKSHSLVRETCTMRPGTCHTPPLTADTFSCHGYPSISMTTSCHQLVGRDYGVATGSFSRLAHCRPGKPCQRRRHSSAWMCCQGAVITIATVLLLAASLLLWQRIKPADPDTFKEEE